MVDQVLSPRRRGVDAVSHGCVKKELAAKTDWASVVCCFVHPRPSLDTGEEKPVIISEPIVAAVAHCVSKW